MTTCICDGCGLEHGDSDVPPPAGGGVFHPDEVADEERGPFFDPDQPAEMSGNPDHTSEEPIVIRHGLCSLTGLRRGGEPTSSDVADRPLFGRVQAWSASQAERRGAASIRGWLAHGLHGHVVELGPGRGLQFAHYPCAVTRVTALEPEPTLRSMAHLAPRTVPVELVDARAQEIPFPDASVDAVVCAGVLCSVSDIDATLSEITRVLAPGGALRIYDHVRARSTAGSRVQELVDRSGLWARAMAGCRLDNDPLAALRRAPRLITEAAYLFTFCPTPLDVLVAPKLVACASREVLRATAAAPSLSIEAATGPGG